MRRDSRVKLINRDIAEIKEVVGIMIGQAKNLADLTKAETFLSTELNKYSNELHR